MNIGQLKQIINDLDDDMDVVNEIQIECGMSVSGGTDESPDIEVVDGKLVINGSCDDEWFE